MFRTFDTTKGYSYTRVNRDVTFTMRGLLPLTCRSGMFVIGSTRSGEGFFRGYDYGLLGIRLRATIAKSGSSESIKVSSFNSSTT